MFCFDIIYVRYLKEDGSGMSIGGIETYISQLVKLISDLGYKSRIFQFSNNDFLKYDAIGTEIHGIYSKGRKLKHLYDSVFKSRQQNTNYITIIANDELIPDYYVKNSIAIQHGIGFDKPERENWPFLLSFLFCSFKSLLRVKKNSNVSTIVCVDNNYICWYRTQTPNRSIRFIPILNFTEIPSSKVNRTDDIVRIVFARRFEKYRGTRLFAPVAKKILNKFSNVNITFAGTGPDFDFLYNEFGNNPNVCFTKYNSSQSIEFHSQFDISVVPTTGSEGTSLSLLEAMAAHCSVVCTNVGGMTNIILDGYNGLMVSPDENELYDAIERLINNKDLRENIAHRGYETVKSSFSLGIWRDKWTQVLTQKIKDYE